MRVTSLPLVLVTLFGVFLLGASCNGSSGTGANAGSGDKPAAETAGRVEKLEQVDTSQLTDAERRVFVDLSNELLSPCGEPVSVARCVVESRACRTCVPAARYVARLVAEGFERNELKELYAARFDAKKRVAIDTQDAPMRGAPMARVQIVEFSDFECPYCGKAHPALSKVIEEFDGQVNLAFKNFPLSGHKNALPAARAATAAQNQGKFWELADKLFEHQRELTAEKIRELAVEAKLDMAKFDADFASAEVDARVARDRKQGETLDIQGTPTLFVNGRPFRESIQNLPKYIKEELAM
jgi:protein-disulfide isomerase